MVYYTMVKSSSVFIHDCSMIPPYPLLFFGGEVSVQEEEGQEIIAVDHWIKFQAPKKIAELVKVHCMCTHPHLYVLYTLLCLCEVSKSNFFLEESSVIFNLLLKYIDKVFKKFGHYVVGSLSHCSLFTSSGA